MKELMSKMNDAKKELPIIKDALSEAKINILLNEKKTLSQNTDNVLRLLKEDLFDFDDLYNEFSSVSELARIVFDLDLMINAIEGKLNETIIMLELIEEGKISQNKLNFNVVFEDYLNTLINIVNYMENSNIYYDSVIYNFVFSNIFAGVFNMACDIYGINHDYYDPDASYSEDYKAFIRNVKDILKR